MKTIFVFFFFFLSLAGCISSGPKTQYYSLLASSNPPSHALENTSLSIGVGPIALPEYVEHPGIVSTTSSNRIIVSGYNAWAGELKENMSRVIAANLAASFAVEQVWAFPWNNQIRPDYRIRVVFEDFAGERGGAVQLVVRWTLLDKKGRERLLVEREVIGEQSASFSYNDYVAALNRALNELSNIIASKTAAHVNPQ